MLKLKNISHRVISCQFRIKKSVGTGFTPKIVSRLFSSHAENFKSPIISQISGVEDATSVSTEVSPMPTSSQIRPKLRVQVSEW
jgi:hypothetical protein